MVTTRGKRPAAAGNAASDEAANGPDTNTRYGKPLTSLDLYHLSIHPFRPWDALTYKIESLTRSRYIYLEP